MRLAQDRDRIRAFLAGTPGADSRWLALHPCYQAIWLHRWSHYYFMRGNRIMARFLWHLNVLLTGADINPMTDLGGGAVLANPAGSIVHCRAGQRFTAFGGIGIGGGLDRRDIGAGPGLPILGNDVVMEYGAYVLGPIRIGDGVVVKAGGITHRDIPSGATAPSPPSMILRQRDTTGDHR